jgi:hypothetical protein
VTFWNDVRLAARLLLKDKWFTLAAVAALALGIAATNTVFTLVNGVLLRDLPFEDPDRIVSVGVRNPSNGLNPLSSVSYADVREWHALLFGVTPGDFTTFAVAASLLLLAAIAACLVPSIRATRVDPIVALRAE